jgi:hypothetical protein
VWSILKKLSQWVLAFFLEGFLSNYVLGL